MEARNRRTTTDAADPDVKWLSFSEHQGENGSFRSQILPLRPGLILIVTRTDSNQPLKARFDLDEAPIQFGFTLVGQPRCTYEHGGFRHQPHQMQPGSNGIFHLPKTAGFIERPLGQPSCVVGIITTPSFLRSYFHDVRDRLPDRFQSMLEGKSRRQFAWFGSSHPLKTQAVAQLIESPFRDELRMLLLESRVLELLAMQIGEYVDQENGRFLEAAPLRPEDADRIMAARNFLIADLEHPPGLAKLAALVGINERKLKIGFRQVFGTSVYGYFREHRMQIARDTLASGDLNVSEVALTIGFQSLSHFSQAFRKRFGVSPKDYLTRQRSLLRP